MKIAFFDAKPYDRPGFDAYTAGTGLDIKYFETKLNEDTVSLASGADGVCVFVNDTLSEAVVDALYALGSTTWISGPASGNFACSASRPILLTL